MKIPKPTIFRRISQEEHLLLSVRCPRGTENAYHLVASATEVILVGTYPQWKDNLESELAFPIESTVWMTNAIFRLLVSADQGGIGGDVLAIEEHFDGLRLRIRRSFNCDGPNELGFTLFRCLHVPGKEWAGFPSFSFSDRLLFNSGFYPALRQLAIEMAKSHHLPEPLPGTATLRPLWMGASPADTPSPEADE